MRWPLLVFFVLVPATAWAAEPSSLTASALQMGWALLIVVGLILALYALARKRPFLGKMGGQAIRVVEMRPLLPKNTLVLVEVRGKEYLLGISSNGIHLLADLSGPHQDDSADFAAVLAKTP